MERAVQTAERRNSKPEQRCRGAESRPAPRRGGTRPLFYPAWEMLPHEARLPHADVISERLETLVALCTGQSTRIPNGRIVVVTTVVALLQRTFAAGGNGGADAR